MPVMFPAQLHNCVESLDAVHHTVAAHCLLNKTRTHCFAKSVPSQGKLQEKKYVDNVTAQKSHYPKSAKVNETGEHQSTMSIDS